MNHNHIDFEAFQLVITESEFRDLLRLGYAGGFTESKEDSNFHFVPVYMSKRLNIDNRRGEIVNPDIQLGDAVTIKWDPTVMAALGQDRLTELESGDLEVYSLLPLVDKTFGVGFKNAERWEQFTREMRVSLDSALMTNLTHSLIDPDLPSAPIYRPRTPDSLFPLLGHQQPAIIPRSLVENSIRTNRLHGAVGLVLASESGSIDNDLIRALIDPSTSPTTEVVKDLYGVRWRAVPSSSVLSVACEFLMSRPIRTALSPMAIEEKSDLVLAILEKSTCDEGNRTLLKDLLDLVRSGEGLNHLLGKTRDLSIQGLIVNLSNNRDPREVALLKAKNFGVDPLALAICAFLTGLRYPREMLPRDLVWAPLRTADVLDYTSLVNDRTWGPLTPTRQSTLVGDEIYFDNKIYQTPTQVDVLEVLESTFTCHVASKNEIYGHRVRKIILRDRSAVSKCKKTVVYFPKETEHRELLRRLHVKSGKTGWKITPFKNVFIDKYMEQVECVEFMVDGPFWIEIDNGERSKYSTATVCVPLNALNNRSVLAPKTVRGKKMLNLLLGSFSRQFTCL